MLNPMSHPPSTGQDTPVSPAPGSIRLENIVHRFKHDQTGPVVLDRVSLDVKAGEFLSIIGPSGCGKTTLLRIIHGLVQPSSGTTWVNGCRVTKPDQTRAMVFQDFRLFPWRNVLDNIGFGLEIRSVGRRQRHEKSQALLDLVGLRGFEKHYIHQLSGGMRQRVALARALAVEPQVLLMDEPFGALDAQTRELMQAELLRIWEARKTTVVFITHSIDEAIFLSDRVAVLSSRPSNVKELISISLPRPRTEEKTRLSAEFLEYRRLLWHSLANEMKS